MNRDKDWFGARGNGASEGLEAIASGQCCICILMNRDQVKIAKYFNTGSQRIQYVYCLRSRLQFI